MSTVLLCSYVLSPSLFIYTFGCGFGIGKGLMYSSVLKAAWTHLPGRKGVASGIIISGFGFGGFLFGNVSHHLCNPDNVKVMAMTTNDGHVVRLFPESVAVNVPYMLRTLDCIFFGLIAFGTLTISKYNGPEIKEHLLETETTSINEEGVSED